MDSSSLIAQWFGVSWGVASVVNDSLDGIVRVDMNNIESWLYDLPCVGGSE